MHSTSIILASLNRWHAAVRSLPNKNSFLKATPRQVNLAWKGDRILQKTLVEAVRKSPELSYQNRRTSGNVVNFGLSNQFMAENIQQLLPAQKVTNPGPGGKSENHRQGTIFEASVAKVANNGNHAAILDLVEWMANKVSSDPRF